jgi:probable addiction module antidote protein
MNAKTKIKYRTIDDVFMQTLNSEKAINAYMEVAMEDFEESGDVEAFILALRTIAEAKGGINRLAEKTHRTRQSLYKALSPKGNPRLDTTLGIINALGFSIKLKPLKIKNI